MKKYKLIILFLFFLNSCSSDIDTANKKFQVIETAEFQFDLRFTKKLWDDIYAKAPLTIKPSKGVYETFLPLPTIIELRESKGLPLGGKNFKFEFNLFGGEIDWNTHLDKNHNGVIDVRIYFPGIETLEHDSLLSVYFMGWTDVQEKDGDVWGSGCNKILNITKYFNKKISNKGLLLHTKDLRYLYGSAGRFYFVVYQKEKILISQVSFTDSQYENEGGYLCPNKI